VVALNQPSFLKYQPLVKPGGLMLYNHSLIDAQAQRTDLRYVAVPANLIAEELRFPRLANVALLGALLAATGMLSIEAVELALDRHLSERQRKYLTENKAALRRGAAYGVPAEAPA
jgi:2-oxoglutarate ferredoxin oxidoreductase subunit gamma